MWLVFQAERLHANMFFMKPVLACNHLWCVTILAILSSQVVSLPLQSVIQEVVILEVAKFCAAMDTFIGQDAYWHAARLLHTQFLCTCIYFNIHNLNAIFFFFFNHFHV